MFDWDDQELADIIWGEDTEGDDHIVPYPEEIENKDLPDYGDNDKRTLNVEDTNSKAVQKSSASKLFSGGKQGKKHGVSASGIVMDPQHDLPSFASSQLNDNVIAKKTEVDTGPEISGNQHEDRELGELVGNSWANIGSFDDLDRMFSNDELDASLGNDDALWSSSLIEPNSENLHYEYPSAARSCEKTGITSSHPRSISGRLVEQQKYNAAIPSLIEEKTTFSLTGNTATNSPVAAEKAAPPNNFSDKDDWSKNQRKHGQILDKVSDPRLSGDVYDTWPSSTANIPQYDPGCAPATMQPFPVPVHSQQRLANESKPMAYQHFTNAYVPAYSDRNFPQQYPATQMLRPADNEHQSILADSEARQGDVATAGHFKMTPQEKIEKLRWRQQMRAMLAIQKQHKQLRHQASSADYPNSQKGCQDDQIMHMGKSNLEGGDSLTTLPCYDTGSQNKMDDPSTISDLDEYSAEDTVLYQLQDIIASLDVNVRQCIKYSLYRLAQSASQRHFASDTNTAKRSGTCDPDVAKDDMSGDHRMAGNENVETETNHIDRAVAHLLFHRPLKLPVKHETPESSTSYGLSTEQEMAVSSLPSGYLAKGPDNDFILSPSGSKPPRPFLDACQEDVPTGMSETDIKINSQMEQKMVEHAD